MKNIFTYLTGILIAILVFGVNDVKAQWTLDVIGSVKKEETKKRFDGVTITIKRNGSTWKTLTTESTGKFEANLEPNAVYMIEFSKPGHVTKRVQFSTKGVPPEDAKYGFEFPMEMNLFEKIDGLDVSILNQPIAKVAFDPSTGYMDYDAAYTKSIKAELDRLKKELAERLKQLEAERKAKQAEYDKTIALADKAFGSEKWKEAKPLYEKAAGIFPNEEYPKERIKEVDEKLAAMAEQDKFYNKAIADADAAFGNKDWDNAKMNYQKASSLKPDEDYPKDKIKEIEDLIANQAKIEEDYKNAIAEADNLFGAKEYEEAKKNYQKALEIKSGEAYPTDKISEIDQLLADQLKADKEYNDAIAEGDAQLEAKDYEKAILTYKKAEIVKPEENYPKEKIAEAQQLLDEQKQREGEYLALISEGDNLMASKDYENAKSKFEAALEIKTDEYPQNKITEIEALLAELAKQKELDEAYQALIDSGDDLFGSEKYEEAKSKYTEALTLKADETYPKEKLNEIEGLLKKLAEEKEAQELQAQYDELIAKADGAFDGEKYEEAKSFYQSALQLKENETYPKERIAEIEAKFKELAEQQAAEEEALALQKEYDEMIAKADAAFDAENYDDAKSNYNSAIGIKGDEQYPKDRIVEIDALLAELAKKKAEEEAAAMAQQERDAKYNELISAADADFNSKNYDNAKLKYSEAMGVKPDESYPQSKIDEINDILAALAEKEEEDKLAAEALKKKKEYYDAVIAQADAELVGKNYDEAKSKYQEAQNILPEETYPGNKIKEIDDLLAKLKADEEATLLAEQEKEAKYNSLIEKGDSDFDSENYEASKKSYQEALLIKPAEAYPTNRIAEIDKLLAEKEAEITLTNNALKQKQERYDGFIKAGDAAFDTKQYNEAIASYNSALGIMPNETYPKDRIAAIEKLLSDLALAEKEKENAALAEQEKRDRYNKHIYDGDRALKFKKYTKAKSEYESALALFGNEQYPKDKLAELEALMKEEPVEEEIAVTTNTGTRVKIDDSKEREMEEMMANWIKDRNSNKNVAVQKIKDEQKNQQEQQVKKLDEKIKKTNDQLIKLEADIAKQKDQGNEYHRQNFDSLENYTVQHNQKEFDRIDYSENKRQDAKNEVITVRASIKDFQDSQDQQLEDKVIELYSFADAVNEQKTILIENANDRRSDNHTQIIKDEEQVRKDMELGEKQRKDREIDLVKYERELTTQKEKYLKASSKKRGYSQDSLVDLVADIHKQQLKSSKFYETNVKELENFEKMHNKRKSQQMKNAGKRMADNQKALDKEVARIEKSNAQQEKKYYKKVAYLDAYKANQAKFEAELTEGQEKNYINAKEQINKDREKYYGQIKKKEDAHLENAVVVEEEKQQFGNFSNDLNAMSLAKARGVKFDHLYAGEKKMKQNIELSNKYPQGISEETYEEGSAMVLKRIKITGTQADIYERRFYKWGGTFYTKNGYSITKTVWDIESIE